MNILNTGLLGSRKGKDINSKPKSEANDSKVVDKDVDINEGEEKPKSISKDDEKTQDDKESVSKECGSIDNVQVEKPPRKTVKLSKIGTEHLMCNVNNQDFAFNFMNIKVVSDGCGSGKHSEVGARLFGQLFSREVVKFIDCINKKNAARTKKYVVDADFEIIAKHLLNMEIPKEAFIGIVNSVLEKMLSICNDTAFVFENYCFTILACLEFKDEFVVFACGDGFIIKENNKGINFERLDNGEFPAYYIYNWIEPEKLTDYKEGVEFKVFHYPKNEYKNVGVASDGLRYFDELYEPDQYKFLDILSKGKTAQIEMFVNRVNKSNNVFRDDLSICF